MYTFKNTEKTNLKASEFETKSMLYLIGMRYDKKEVETLLIDCFNDVTGVNESFTKLWDIQSKNYSKLPPSVIGKSLYTLYDNYISDITFTKYILFIPKINNDYLVDEALKSYKYHNIKDETKKGIEKGLIKEIKKRNGKIKETPPLFTDFLSKITFVEDHHKISTYIKRLSKFKNKKIVSEEFYNDIFKEIRDKQSVLKNSYIEGVTINTPIEVLKLNRHLTKKSITTLVISRSLGVDIFSTQGRIPTSFIEETRALDEEEIKDLLLECNANLAKAFFNKNDCKTFWYISEFIFEAIRKEPSADIYNIFTMLKEHISYDTTYYTRTTLLYMISLVKLGFK